jgi:hypothetical protein
MDYETAENHANVLDAARDILEKNAVPATGEHMDVALCALVRGVEIGLMDSAMSLAVLQFAKEHERLKPLDA